MSAPKLKQHDNGYWYIHWTVGRRSKKVSTTTKVLAEAQLAFADWLRLDAEGAKAAPRGFEPPTIAVLWKAYYDGHARKFNISTTNADSVWKNVKTFFGDLTPADVTPEKIEDYQNRRANGRIGRPSKPQTVRRELAILRACMNWCASRDNGRTPLILESDIPRFALPEAGEARDRWLREPEITRLLSAAAQASRSSAVGGRLSRVECFLWLALNTAARAGAILDLTWDRVDFEIGVIDLNKPGRRKTKKRRAVVPISDALLPVLKRMNAERIDKAFDALVIPRGSGPWRLVKAVAKQAGLKDVTPNVLRHTAATHAARRGVPLWLIAKMLGNSLIMVEKVYAKHAPSDLREAVNAVGITTHGMTRSA